MEYQTTLKKPVFYSGISLHQGIKANIVFRPAPANHGIRFARIDLEHKPCILACLEHIHSLNRGTTIASNGITIHTIEHVLAAFSGMGVDNALVEVDAHEPPVGDGSSLPFLDMIEEAQIITLKEPRRYIELKELVSIEEKDTTLVAIPYHGFKISYTLSYKNTHLGDQFVSFEINPHTFKNEIGNARTFCFYDEVESLMDLGLIKGGSLDNAVVVTQNAILSKEALRYSDECVRHKVLDLIGDLYLLGAPLKAHIIAIKSGHALNVRLAEKIEKLMASYTTGG